MGFHYATLLCTHLPTFHHRQCEMLRLSHRPYPFLSSTALVTDCIICYFCPSCPSSQWTGSSTRAGVFAGRGDPSPATLRSPEAQCAPADRGAWPDPFVVDTSQRRTPELGHPAAAVPALLAVRLWSRDTNAILERVRSHWRPPARLTDSVLRLLNQSKRDFYFTSLCGKGFLCGVILGTSPPSSSVGRWCLPPQLLGEAVAKKSGT